VFVDGFRVDDEDVVRAVAHLAHGLKPLQNKGFSASRDPEALSHKGFAVARARQNA
jgi:hypothetical protein